MARRRAMSLIVVALALGCGKTEPKRAWRGTGTVVFTPSASAKTDLDVFMATEIEMIKSRRVVERALASRHASSTDAQGHIVVTRRGASLVLEVAVDGDEPAVADRCNAILEAYVEQRMEEKIVALRMKEQVLE